MERALLRLIYMIAFYFGIVALFYYFNRHRQIVLTYHNILPDELFDNSLHLGMSHSESVFARQLEIIKRRWPTSRSGAADACLVTFDDGYRNQYEIASNILERHGHRGVFFVTLDLVVDRTLLWPDQFLMWLSYVPNGSYQLLGQWVEIGGGDSRSRCWSWIWEQILTNYNCREDIKNSMDAAFPFDKLPIDQSLKALRFEGMTFAQTEELARKGHRIGCHSYRHDVLACLTDAALDDDFARCEDALDWVFNCDFYSYPFGGPREVTERERSACRKSRFRRAFMNVERLEPSRANDGYAIPRTSLPNTMNRYVIEAKLSGFDKFLKTLLVK